MSLRTSHHIWVQYVLLYQRVQVSKVCRNSSFAMLTLHFIAERMMVYFLFDFANCKSSEEGGY